MAERLTEKDKYGNNAIFQKKDKFTIAKDKNNDIRVYGKAIDKLAQFEDIMEKYGIESVEELDYLLEVFKKMRKQYGKLNQENCKSKKELDTWKRACELACEEINCSDNYGSKTYTIPPEEMLQYFYQQAKKEGENNDTNN